MPIPICYKQFCPYLDRQEGVYQKAFLAAKFAKRSQRSQRGNYLFIKMLPILSAVAFFAVILNAKLSQKIWKMYP